MVKTLSLAGVNRCSAEREPRRYSPLVFYVTFALNDSAEG